MRKSKLAWQRLLGVRDMEDLIANHIYPSGVPIAKKNETKGKVYKDNKLCETLGDVLLQYGRPVIPEKSFTEANKPVTIPIDTHVPLKENQKIQTELEALSGKEKEQQGVKDLQRKMNDVLTLTEPEANVLNYLNGEFPQFRYQTDIEAACKINQKIVMSITKKLAQHSLISHPEAKKRGWVITPSGREYIEKHRPCGTVQAVL